MSELARKRGARSIVVAVAVIASFVGGSAWGVNPFTDIAGSSHANNIDAIFNAGITLGCATEPDRYCPDNVVTRGQMASFLARGLGLSSGTSKNFPKANSRSPEQAYCALAAASPQSFESAACTALSTAVDSESFSVGQYTSIAISATGNPVVSYYDKSLGDLNVAACDNSTCSGDVTITTLDSAGDVGGYTSIAIGATGNPVVSYYDFTNGDLKVAACTTTNCSGDPDTFTLASTGDVGLTSSIAIGLDGIPVISYYDFTNGDLEFLRCASLSCDGTPAVETLDSAGDVGLTSSIAIGNKGRPIISYYDATNGDLKVAACNDTTCQTDLRTSLDTTDDTGFFTSIAIGTNSLPIISYLDSDGRLKVAACTTVNCIDTPTISVVDGKDLSLGSGTSIAIGTNGLPVISYHDVNAGELKLAACTNTGCTGIATLSVVDSAGTVGIDSSITIGATGIPIISHYDSTNRDLKVARPQVQ